MISMSPKYTIFVKLGTNKDLAKLELSVLLDKIGVNDISFTEWMDYILLKLNRKFFKSFFKLLDNTGSIIKAGYLNSEVSTEKIEEWEVDFKNHLLSNIEKRSLEKNKMLKISLDVQTKNLDLRNKIISFMKVKITEHSKEKQIPLKIFGAKKSYSELTPYQYYKETFSKRGIEFVCLIVKSRLIYGITNWVTNPLLDIKQDEGRKVRMFTHGTSIKLARTLVFLSEVEENGVLLDPFCGTGTILIEALKQKMRIIGIDKDPKCFRATKDNLNNFSLQFPSKTKMKDNWEVYHQDSKDLEKVLKGKQLAAIVTEPYLGPFLKNLPSIEEAKYTMKSLEKLYIRILKAGASSLKSTGKIVFIVPSYKYSNDLEILPNIEAIANQCSLVALEKSRFLHVSFPISIGRAHNVINRYLVIFHKT